MQACAQIATGDVESQQLTALVLDIVVAVVAVFDGLSFGALTPFLLVAISAAFAAAAAIEMVIASKYLDSDNIAALSCLMFQNLANLPLTVDGLQQAYTNASCLTSDQQAIATALSAVLDNAAYAEQILTQFLNVNGEAYTNGLGELYTPDCGCDTGSWCWTMTPANFAGWFFGQKVYINDCATIATTVDEFGQITGGYWQMTNNAFGGDGAVCVEMNLNLPAGTTLTAMTITGAGAGMNASVIEINGTQASCHTGGSSEAQFTGGSYTGALNIKCMDGYNGPAGHSITSIIFSGTGINPFALCDNC